MTPTPGLLGNITNGVSALDPTTGDSDGYAKSKFANLAIASEVLGHEWRTHRCMQSVLGGKVSVERTVHGDGCGKPHYRGLLTCGSVWTCPVCAAKIAAKRADEIKSVAKNAVAIGYQAVLVTYTLQHTIHDPLDILLTDLKTAIRYNKSGRAHERFNSRHGVLGYVRGIEIRYGKNGWHPHAHELLFVRPGVDGNVDCDDIKRSINQRYGKKLADLGYLVNDATIDVRTTGTDNETVSQYLTKTAVELEITGNELKSGKSLSPFQLLSFADQHEYANLFREYAHSTKGKMMLTWSRNLRSLSDLDELTDEEIAAMPDGEIETETDGEIDGEVVDGEIETELILVLDRVQWKRVVAAELRADLLLACDRLTALDLEMWLIHSGIVAAAEMPKCRSRRTREGS